MNNVMLDLETLSTAPNAAVLSIGLAVFDDEQVIDTLSVQIEPREVLGHIEPDTVAWWMGQGDAAKRATFGGKSTPWQAAQMVQDLFQRHQPAEVWANSPSFDCTILKSFFAALKNARPPFHVPELWKYRAERDYRTLINEARRYGCPVDLLSKQFATGTAHSAVDDACYQARVLIGVRKWLKANGPRTTIESAA